MRQLSFRLTLLDEGDEFGIRCPVCGEGQQLSRPPRVEIEDPNSDIIGRTTTIPFLCCMCGSAWDMRFQEHDNWTDATINIVDDRSGIEGEEELLWPDERQA